MRMVSVAFDIDGVLKDITSDDTNIRINERIRSLLVILASFKNVEIYAWSKRGSDWAKTVCEAADVSQYIKTYLLKEKLPFTIDIVIDDEHSTDLGRVNLITNELGHKPKPEWFK